MLYQKEPLRPQHEYFLDCAAESDELTAFGWNVLSLLGDRKVVGKIMDAPNARDNWRWGRQQKCFDLDTYAHELVAELPRHEQEAFTAITLIAEPYRLNSLIEYLSQWNHEDATVGGCAIDFRKNRRCDDNYDPTPRVRRRLYAPSAIRRYVKLEDSSIPVAREFARRLQRLPLARHPAQAKLVSDLIREQRQQFRGAAEARARYEAEMWSDLGAPRAPIAGEARKVTKRAAKTAAAILGPEKVSAFARGVPVVIEGQNLKLQVQPRGSIVRTGHGAIDVRLLGTDGQDLSGVCVYFDKIPALDQLSALALHVQAGDEREIIKTGNLYGITPAGAAHPIVAERQASKRLVERDPDLQAVLDRIMRHGLSQSDQDRKRAAQQRYLRDTRHIYLEAVETRIWGRCAKVLSLYKEAVRFVEEHADLLLNERIAQSAELAEAA